MKTVNEMLYSAIVNRNGTDANKLKELGYDVRRLDDGRYVINGCAYAGEGGLRCENGRRAIWKDSRQELRLIDLENLLSREKKHALDYMYVNCNWRGHSQVWWSMDDKLCNGKRQNRNISAYKKAAGEVAKIEREIALYELDIERAQRNLESSKREVARAKRELAGTVEELKASHRGSAA